jgi:hypothetical protein
MEESQFVKDSYAEIDEMERQELEANEWIKEILAQPEDQKIGVYKYGNLEIRYKPFLTSKLRNLLRTAQKKSKQPDADVLAIQDTLVYEGLAEICVEPLLKNPHAWQLLDLKSNDGRVYTLFKGIMERIGAGDTGIKSFR